MGIVEERVLAAAGKPSVEDIGPDDLLTLKGIATALKDGDTTVEDAFPGPKTQEASEGSKSDALAKAAKGRKRKKKDEPKPEAPPEEPEATDADDLQTWLDESLFGSATRSWS
jgi:hypothetical protein